MENIRTKQLFAEETKIGDAMQQVGDQVNAQKIQDLIQKGERKEWVIAFCGHFSAGKSTLVNALCEANILPSSPIPTSANIVSIRYGTEKTAFVTKKLNDQLQRIQVELDQLEAYCTDGDAIESVDITFPAKILNSEGLVIVDTPGMDSTDDRHREQTLGALHLADVVIYVSDYNHVQSEFNLSFAKQMKQIGKPFYFIINQIDKHRDEEISFDTFMDGVKRSFKDWGAEPDGLLTLSLKEREHRYDEWSRLLWLIRSLSTSRDQLREVGMKKAVTQCLEAHGEWRFANWRDEHEDLVIRMETLPLSEALIKAEQYQQAADHARMRADQTVSKLKEDVNKLLENANVTPALTRDKVYRYLETKKKGFKASWWHSKKQTEKETKAREQDLLLDVNENVDTQVVTHLIDILQPVSEMSTESPKEWSFDVSGTDIDSLIQPGAIISTEYALVYSRSLSAFIKDNIRKKVWQLLEGTLEQLRKEDEIEVKRYESLSAEIMQTIQAHELWNTFQSDWHSLKESWINALGLIRMDDIPLPDWNDAPQTNDHHAVNGSKRPVLTHIEHVRSERSNDLISEQSHQDQTPLLPEQSDHRIDQFMPFVSEAISIIDPLPLLKEMKERWEARRQQWKNRQLTIALFGAFSAGKSSFINALLGESLLPSSPHPTTASICRVLPPDSQHDHGQVRVMLKTKQQLEEELGEVFALFNWPFHHLEQAIEDGLKRFKSSPVAVEKGQNEYEFLKAVSAGYEEMSTNLGKHLVVDFHDLKRYVAEEKISAYVASIDVYYDSPLAKQGIVLVDTPGANSMNARHTRVSFEYIKQADALVYVTYYNHVFSDADRQFLSQLGQVRERLELDNMFFIVNAKDLSSSEDELELVMDHVTEQLHQQDLRQPRLYALSSLQALRGKKGDRTSWEQSGMQPFETDFYPYIFGQLIDLMRISLTNEVDQSIDALQAWNDSIVENEAQREQKMKETIRYATEKCEQLNEHRSELPANDRARLERDINDLIYYARQRIYYRWGEAFNHAFHPSNLSGTKSEGRIQLWIAWKQLNATLKNECLQELLQSSLQIEKNMSTWMQHEVKQVLAEIHENVPTYPMIDMETPVFTSPQLIEDWNAAGIDERWLVKHFKNPQSFFEGDGKKKMRDEMESMVMKTISEFMEKHIFLFSEHYAAEWLQLSTERNQIVRQSLDSHLKTLSAMKADQGTLQLNESSIRQLQQLRSSIEEMKIS